MKVAFEAEIHHFHVLCQFEHGYAQEVNDGNSHAIMTCLNIMENQGNWRGYVYTIRRSYTGAPICSKSSHFLVTTKGLTREVNKYRRTCDSLIKKFELINVLPSFVMWTSEFGFSKKIQAENSEFWYKMREKHHRAHNNVDIDMAYENWRCGETNG